jgi:hypothetical protein
LEQQGETIIESLVDRLRQEVPRIEEASRPNSGYAPYGSTHSNAGVTTPVAPNGNGGRTYPETRIDHTPEINSEISRQVNSETNLTTPVVPAPTPAAPPPAKKGAPSSLVFRGSFPPKCDLPDHAQEINSAGH